MMYHGMKQQQNSYENKRKERRKQSLKNDWKMLKLHIWRKELLFLEYLLMRKALVILPVWTNPTPNRRQPRMETWKAEVRGGDGLGDLGTTRAKSSNQVDRFRTCISLLVLSASFSKHSLGNHNNMDEFPPLWSQLPCIHIFSSGHSL